MLTDLDVALASRGIPYTPVGYSSLDPTGAADWTTRGRPASTGSFEPQGVLCHHTAAPTTASTAASLGVVLRGNSQAPGPIAQIYISRQPIVFLVAAGRANHGGRGIRPGIDSGCQDMNRFLLGIEVDNNGIGEPWNNDQIVLYARVVEALCAHYHWDIGTQVFLHATTGPPSGGCNSKIDPAGPWLRQPDIGARTWDLNTWRAYCVEQTPHEPPPPPPPGDDDMPTPVGFITCNAGVVGHHIDGSTYTIRIDGTYFYVMPAGTIQWVHDGGELSTKKSILAGAGMRADTWNTPVGDPDVFGMLVGDKPG
jgi:hypothetical protein